jgi:hypothetical protein
MSPTNTLFQDFAKHPEKWASLPLTSVSSEPSKTFVARNLSLTVEEMEARITKAIAELPRIVSIGRVKVDDMPENILHGRLGDWVRSRMSDLPRAYAWPAILAAASCRLAPMPGNKSRTNLYVALVGPTYSGKTEAQKRASYLVGLPDDIVTLEGFGSAEGMLEKIGERGGSPYLWMVDELSHVMGKANIRGASFYKVLNIIFSHSKYNITVEKRKAISFNARLTLAGGIVEDKFGDCFTAESEAGLYSRFLFGQCPSGYKYFYHGEPEELGPPMLEPASQPFESGSSAPVIDGLRVPSIDKEVYEANEALARSENIGTRVLELVTRCALICGAIDGEDVIRASRLEPFWNFARYQTELQKTLLPLQGLNHEALAGELILNACLTQRGVWLRSRDVCKKTKAYRFGSSTCDRAIAAMDRNGELDVDYQVPRNGGKKVRIIKAADEDKD